MIYGILLSGIILGLLEETPIIGGWSDLCIGFIHFFKGLMTQ